MKSNTNKQTEYTSAAARRLLEAVWRVQDPHLDVLDGGVRETTIAPPSSRWQGDKKGGTTMKYIVAYAEYNTNESHDALTCGVIPKFYATVEAAHEDIMECIREEVEDAMSDGEYEGETVEDVVRGWTWLDEPRHVAAEHDGIESVYEVCAV